MVREFFISLGDHDMFEANVKFPFKSRNHPTDGMTGSATYTISVRNTPENTKRNSKTDNYDWFILFIRFGSPFLSISLLFVLFTRSVGKICMNVYSLLLFVLRCSLNHFKGNRSTYKLYCNCDGMRLLMMMILSSHFFLFSACEI